MRCEWRLRAAAADSGVELRFVQFNLEPENTCEYDQVQIFDGDQSNEANRFGRFCGDKVGDLSGDDQG